MPGFVQGNTLALPIKKWVRQMNACRSNGIEEPSA